MLDPPHVRSAKKSSSEAMAIFKDHPINRELDRAHSIDPKGTPANRYCCQQLPHFVPPCYFTI
jgi:hypothetical protein